MKLYHGTSSAVALAALREGLRTRQSHGGDTMWPDNPSRPDAVYLTDAYALYFGLVTLSREDSLADGRAVGVVEVDTDLLDEYQLVPDEDALEQVYRGRDKVRGSMEQRTAYYRKRLHKYVGKHHGSLAVMGTCAHLGDIPREAVTRIAIVEPQRQPLLCMQALDPTISVMNYMIMGQKYRDLTAEVFAGNKDGITIYTSL